MNQSIPSLKQKSYPSLRSNLNMLRNILQGQSDPSSIIQNILLKNPQMQNIMQLFQQSGMSAKQFFYQYAQQNGIDPDQFLNS